MWNLYEAVTTPYSFDCNGAVILKLLKAQIALIH